MWNSEEVVVGQHAFLVLSLSFYYDIQPFGIEIGKGSINSEIFNIFIGISMSMEIDGFS